MKTYFIIGKANTVNERQQSCGGSNHRKYKTVEDALAGIERFRKHGEKVEMVVYQAILSNEVATPQSTLSVCKGARNLVPDFRVPHSMVI